jgi:multicomponent K+:H+ antiporter subunit G
MIQAPDLPAWAAILVALLVLTGAGITFIGSLGLLRLKSFYQRMHAPTLGTTLGMGFIVAGSMLCFSVLQSRPMLHELLIALFVTVTTPITLMLLGRAALYRDRTDGEHDTLVEAPPPND